MDAQKRLLLQQRALEALRERIGSEHYLSVKEVCERLGLSRQVVESLPMEILPYEDYGSGKRSLRRYHPADVLAAGARIRAWKRARERGEGEAYLRRLREELEERDRLAIQLAHDMVREMAVA